MSEIKTIINRRKNYEGKKYWLTTTSIRSDFDGKWSNCLYLHFVKDEFPFIKSPPLVECNWMASKQRFDYCESVLNRCEFHGGITFYKEMYHAENAKTYVKVGCDYQHLHDKAYQYSDFGVEIIRDDGTILIQSFEKLLEEIKENQNDK